MNISHKISIQALSHSLKNSENTIYSLIGLVNLQGYSFDLINFSNNSLETQLQNIDFEYNEIKLLILGNQIQNGILIVSEDLNIESQIIKDHIFKLPKTKNDFFVLFYNSNNNDYKKIESYKINFELNVFELTKLDIINKEETNNLLKDFYIVFSSLNYDEIKDIEPNFTIEKLKNTSIVTIKDGNIPIIINENLKFFENKKNNAIIQINDKIKDNNKSIKTEFKQKCLESSRINTFSNLPIKELNIFFENEKENQKSDKMVFLVYKKQICIQTATIIKLEESLNESISQHLIKIIEDFDYLNSNIKGNKFGLFCFKNEFCNFPRRILLNLDLNNDELKSQKLIYYKKYNLPINRPFFRENDILTRVLSFENEKTEKLNNVHLSLNYNPIPKGISYFIYGSYTYHHYNQDCIDDNGWGCAYRSLQTLISWFNHQKYVDNIPIPTHKQIQQLLISMNDKPKEFLGSNEWIGAFEVCMVLNKLLNIESKILHLSNGSDIIEKVPELCQHFQEQGTPIMFGGGVLAFTLLGIDWNKENNEVNFLILDPHYKGIDNIKNIIDKNGISWKKSNLFLENTFYNFCLPQRPYII